MQLYIFDVV